MSSRDGGNGVQFDLKPFVERLTGRTRLGAAEEQALLGLPTEQHEVDRHQDFVRLDETVRHVCVVVEGVVARFGQTGDGERQITALHFAGDAPDLHTLVLPGDTFPLQSLSNTTILRIPHEALRAIAARYPAVAESFWRHCSVDTAITAQWVVNVGRRDAKKRIAHLLCEMAVRHKAHGGDEVVYPFPLTQTHIGDAMGLTPVHVNRMIRALSDDGLVTVADRRVRILDWKSLVALAEFDARYLQADLRPDERLRIAD